MSNTLWSKLTGGQTQTLLRSSSRLSQLHYQDAFLIQFYYKTMTGYLATLEKYYQKLTSKSSGKLCKPHQFQGSDQTEGIVSMLV